MSERAAEQPNGAHYQSLYRRYRPQQFAEVRGQEHVTHTLRNAVATGRVTHAYLFSGPRGTGKTSTARILAKALNCTELADGEPCGQCESCLAIAQGASFDVHELDAASNNGVDAMRDLVSRASLASPGRWKVYIVDEVHMLSTAASNALLKTLEEPPDHVVFVLATTDPQKVLETIRSRTQHFEFHLLNEDVLEALLSDVASDAALDLPDGAIHVAGRRGKGSARDALSVLDQVITAGVIEDDTDALERIITAIGGRDTLAVIDALNAALHNGRDPNQVAIELVERLRNGFLGLVAPRSSSDRLSVVAKAEAKEVEALGAPRCVRAMELIGAAIVAMRDAPEPRITLEVALIRLTHPEAEDTLDAILDRLDRLERREVPAAEAVHNAPRPAPAAPAGDQATAPSGTPPAPRAPRAPSGSSRPALGAFQGARPQSVSGANTATVTIAPTEEAPKAPLGDGPEDVAVSAMPSRDLLVTAWGDHILVSLRPKTRAYYQAGRFIGVEDSHALFALPNDAHVARAQSLCDEVTAVLRQHFGHPITLRLMVDPAPATPNQTGLDAEPDVATPHGSGGTAPAERPAASLADDALGTEFVADEGVVDPKLGLSWAEDRLREAFPGAEEVIG